MAISVRQALSDLHEGDLSTKGEGWASQAASRAMSGVKRTERLLIERTLMQMYPRLQMYDLLPWKWLNGPLIPDFLARQDGRGLRRMVEIGCGDGAFTNLLALLFPDVEVIGIDTSGDKIADARATVSYRENIRFVRANATVLSDLPCDRIVYNNCLSKLGNVYAFQKMILKTTQWLVDEGDFLIRETPLSLFRSAGLMRELLPRLWRTGSLEASIRLLLSEIGYSAAAVHVSRSWFGLPCQIYIQIPKNPRQTPVSLMEMMSPNGGALVAEPLREWQDAAEQSNDSLVGFLFDGVKGDFTQELA